MFDTNDVFNDAVRGSSIHAEEESNNENFLLGSKLVAILLLATASYVGFSTYSSMTSTDEALVVKNELVAEIQVKSESFVTNKIINVSEVLTNSEEEYLSALRNIESELIEERANIDLDTHEQMSLSSAMNDLMNDNVFADNSGYTSELRKEIGVELDEEAVDSASFIVDNNELEKSRTVIVKKGDTLQGISDKFYGDAMNYKRIIASNDNLNSNDIIYEGQTILLPY